MSITAYKEKPLKEIPKWRDRYGDFHRLVDMNSDWLMNVIVMIWNHTMPYDARTHNYKKYRFNSFYSNEYFIEIIKYGLLELSLRQDLSKVSHERLEKMKSYFYNKYEQEKL